MTFSVVTAIIVLFILTLRVTLYELTYANDSRSGLIIVVSWLSVACIIFSLVVGLMAQ